MVSNSHARPIVFVLPMCPPLGGVIGDGFTATGVPASPAVTLKQVVRDMLTQVTRQSEQFAFFANSMAHMQRQLRALADAATRTSEWMRTHVAIVNDTDKSLGSLRERLDALQSASVSSVETKSIVSGWPVPKIAGSPGSGSHQR